MGESSSFNLRSKNLSAPPIVFFTVVLTTSSPLNNFFLLQSYLRIKVQVSEKSLEKYLEDCMEKWISFKFSLVKRLLSIY